MPKLDDCMPGWVADLCRSPLGVVGTATALAAMGDTPDAKAWYQSLAARLTAFGVNANAPRAASLPDFEPLPDE